MKKYIVIIITVIMLLSATACSGSQTTELPTEPTAKPTEEVQEITEEPSQEAEGWNYDDFTKTLFVNADMGAFEPDAPDFEGTTSNAPWSVYLDEIENIVIGDDVTYIGEYAFAFCTNLKNVEVGKNVGSLDFRCFFKCGNWDSDSNMEFHFNSMPNYGEDAFGYTWDNPNVIVYVPDDMKEHWAQYIMINGNMQLDGYEFHPESETVPDEDFGPFWAINIGGNFDIMSDMVWQSVPPQDITIGSGDTFRGYGLKELMDFSGNGSESANVMFSDGSSMAVSPTYDAYIVYSQNGELMGGPYLLSIEGLSQSTVMQVHPQ